MIKIKHIFLVAAFSPINAFAFGSFGGAMSGTSVHGMACSEDCFCQCQTTSGSMASPSAVNSVQSSVVDAVKQVTGSLSAGQKQQIKAQQNLMNEELQKWAEVQKKLLATEIQLDYQSMSASPDGKTANACSAGSAAAARLNGDANSQKLKKAFDDNFKKWDDGTDSRSANNKWVGTRTNGAIDASSLLDGKGTPSDVNQYIAMVTAPNPPIKLTKDEEKTPDGLNWKDNKSTWKLRSLMAQSSMAYIASVTQPTMDDSDAQLNWDIMGRTDPLPQDKDGLISINGNLEVQAMYRYANPQWYADLSKENRLGVLREINQMGDMRLKQSEMELELVKNMVNVKATEYAKTVDDERVDSLTNLRSRSSDQDIGINTSAKGK